MNLIDLESVFRLIEKQEDFQEITSGAPGYDRPRIVPREELLDRALQEALALGSMKPEIHMDPRSIRRHLDDILPDYDPQIYDRARPIVLYIAHKLFASPFSQSLFASDDLRETRFVDRIPKGKAVLYMPNHNSHMDSFLFSLKLNQLGLDHAYFAAGNNMMATDELARFFKGVRAFKVYRKDKREDHLRTLSALCKTLAEADLPQLTYPEASASGARSRDGTLRIPFKLRTIEGTILSEKDVTVVPVAFSYTRVPEDYTLAHGAGLFHKNLLKNLDTHLDHTSFWTLLSLSPFKSWFQSRTSLYGRLYLTFCEPFSLKDFLASLSQAADPTYELERYAMEQVGRNMKVLPHYIVSAALDRPEAQPYRSSILVEGVKEEIDKLTAFHRKHFGDEPDFSDEFREGIDHVIQEGLKELETRGIISRRPSILRPSRWFKSPQWMVEEGHVRVLDPVLLTVYHNRSHHNLYAPEYSDKICVVGAGQWGYTLAVYLGGRIEEDRKLHRYSVVLTDADTSLRSVLEKERRHPYHFSHLDDKGALPAKVFIKNPKRAIRGSSTIIMVVPSQTFRSAMKNLCHYVNMDFDLVIASKGIERGTNLLMIQIAEELLSASKMAYSYTLSCLSGANLAGEILDGLPAATQISCADYAVAERLRNLFAKDTFKVYTSTDVVGSQLAGALKNVYALAAGLVDGLDLGYNLKANIMSRCSIESRRLAIKMGGSASTFDAANQAWMADLITSCLGGRNHLFGMELGRSWKQLGDQHGDTLEVATKVRTDFIERRLTAEGDPTSAALQELCVHHNADMPIAHQVHRILQQGRNPFTSFKDLMKM